MIVASGIISFFIGHFELANVLDAVAKSRSAITFTCHERPNSLKLLT